MSVAITVTPSGPIAKKSAARIDLTGHDATTASYLFVDAPTGTDDAKSVRFVASHDGKFTWDNYVFPVAGSYTVRLRKVSDDSDIATQAVTVS
jgi:hypothetical protein